MNYRKIRTCNFINKDELSEKPKDEIPKFITNSNNTNLEKIKIKGYTKKHKIIEFEMYCEYVRVYDKCIWDSVTMIMIKKHNDLFKFDGDKFIFNNRYVIYTTDGSNTNIVLDKIYYYKDGYYICSFYMV